MLSRDGLLPDPPRAGAGRLRSLFRPTLGGTCHALPAAASRKYYPEVAGLSAEALLEVE